MISRPLRHFAYIALVMLAVSLFSASFSPTTKAQGVVPPKIEGTFIQDHSGVLSAEAKSQLAERVAGIKQNYGGTEIGLVTIPTLSV